MVGSIAGYGRVTPALTREYPPGHTGSHSHAHPQVIQRLRRLWIIINLPWGYTMTASGRMTLGALFGAITTTANTVSNSLGAINDGVEMLNKTISDASKRQQISSKQDMAAFKEQYALETAQRVQEFHDTLEDWMEQRPNRREKFQQTYDRIQASITEEDKLRKA
jgi:hypothetical protein